MPGGVTSRQDDQMRHFCLFMTVGESCASRDEGVGSDR